MILLKANSKLKPVFLKLINTMGENVKWTDIFLINNNDLILVGKGRSLFFNFDTKKVISNIMELPIDDQNIDRVPMEDLMQNILCFTLYAFGKWGGIKGLTVEKDYEQLNKLINLILEEIDMQAAFSENNFRFFRSGLVATYEDVVGLALKKVNPEINPADAEVDNEDEQENREDNSDEEFSDEDEANSADYEIGLWHKMIWTADYLKFHKENLSEEEVQKSRLGNNFFIVKCECPQCGDKLYIDIFPQRREYRIDTDVEPLYISRAYTCGNCKIFYTPKPQRLLMEGEVFKLNFEDDEIAYGDYIELLGKSGGAVSNHNYNEYESDYKSASKAPTAGGEELLDEIESMSDQDIEYLEDMVDAGFYPKEESTRYYAKIKKELKRRSKRKKKEKNKKTEKESKEKENSDVVTSEHSVIHNDRIYSNQKLSGVSGKTVHPVKPIKIREHFQDKDTSSRDIMPKREKELLSDKYLTDEERNHEPAADDMVSQTFAQQDLETKLLKKAMFVKDKDYITIVTALKEIKEEQIAPDVKKKMVESLKELSQKRGRSELEHLTASIPVNITRKQYQAYRDKIEQYKEIDITPYIKALDEKWDVVEKQEISLFVKRLNTKSRKSLKDGYDLLETKGYEDRNVKPVLETIRDRIRTIDTAGINTICPEVSQLSYVAGLEAYENIALGDYLPELKVNSLALIDKRLTKLKIDECEQLVIKLKKDIGQSVTDHSRIYFYEVRKEDSNPEQVQNALKTYAVDRHRYEYPVMICDTSPQEDGTRGFVLTPDNIFYKRFSDPCFIDALNITDITMRKGLFGIGIYVTIKDGSRIKIAGNLGLNNMDSFADALDKFVSYLQDKPESRDVAYMAKEKHPVKCCYRCGYMYKEGDVCPKCGEKINK